MSYVVGDYIEVFLSGALEVQTEFGKRILNADEARADPRFAHRWMRGLVANRDESGWLRLELLNGAVMFYDERERCVRPASVIVVLGDLVR